MAVGAELALGGKHRPCPAFGPPVGLSDHKKHAVALFLDRLPPRPEAGDGDTCVPSGSQEATRSHKKERLAVTKVHTTKEARCPARHSRLTSRCGHSSQRRLPSGSSGPGGPLPACVGLHTGDLGWPTACVRRSVPRGLPVARCPGSSPAGQFLAQSCWDARETLRDRGDRTAPRHISVRPCLGSHQ